MAHSSANILDNVPQKPEKAIIQVPLESLKRFIKTRLTWLSKEESSTLTLI